MIVADEGQQVKSIRRTISATRERLQSSKRLIRRVDEVLEHPPEHAATENQKE